MLKFIILDEEAIINENGLSENAAEALKGGVRGCNFNPQKLL